MHELQKLLEEWWNEDPELRWVEIFCGQNLRVCVRLYQLVFEDPPGEIKLADVEAATLEEALVSAIAQARSKTPEVPKFKGTIQ